MVVPRGNGWRLFGCNLQWIQYVDPLSDHLLQLAREIENIIDSLSVFSGVGKTAISAVVHIFGW